LSSSESDEDDSFFSGAGRGSPGCVWIGVGRVVSWGRNFGVELEEPDEDDFLFSGASGGGATGLFEELSDEEDEDDGFLSRGGGACLAGSPGRVSSGGGSFGVELDDPSPEEEVEDSSIWELVFESRSVTLIEKARTMLEARDTTFWIET
jgi:hypothetical protein